MKMPRYGTPSTENFSSDAPSPAADLEVGGSPGSDPGDNGQALAATTAAPADAGNVVVGAGDVDRLSAAGAPEAPRRQHRKKKTDPPGADGPPLAPDPGSNGQAAEAPADIGSPTESKGDTSSLKGLISRINPDDIAVDWEAEGLVEADEDTARPARWGGPPKDNFIRAHASWSTGAYLLDRRTSHGKDAEYVLTKAVANWLLTEEGEEESVTAAQVYLLADRDGALIFWPVRMGLALELELRNPSDYVKSSKEAIARARGEWVKVVWRGAKGGMTWKVRAARVKLPEPTWPDDPMALYLRVIKDRYIDNPDDDVIQKHVGRS
jgi:hypothetical protein